MRIDHPENRQIPAMKALWKEAFADPQSFIDSFFETAFSPDRCLCLTAEGSLAAAAYWMDGSYEDGKVAYIYAVATAVRHRGRGYCRSLMEHIHQQLLSEGYAVAVLVPGDEALRRMYSGMGYRSCGGMDIWDCHASGISLPLRELDEEGYALLRRQYLSAGSILQEGPCLTFLRRYAKLYAGADFLLAAVKNGNTIQGLELLGNTKAVGGILTALQAEQGTFRIPGNGPFAMYRPLNRHTAPEYLGLAFD